MDLIISGYKDITKKAIDEGAKNLEEVKQYFYKKNMNFKEDEVFQNFISNIYGLVICETEMNNHI